MEAWNNTLFIMSARLRLENKRPGRIAALHAGVSAAVVLVITLLQFALEAGIGNTAGLSGMQTRSVLQTAQTLLNWGNLILLPFWNLGFLYATIRWGREESVRPGDLLAGFRRFGPTLRLMLIKLLLVIMVTILCANLSGTIFLVTPAAQEILTVMESTGMDYESMMTDIQQMSMAESVAILRAMVPMLVTWLGMTMAILVPLLYRLRMAEYVLMDTPQYGAFGALLGSLRLTRGRGFRLFTLDLRFWWYYLLQVLCALLCYAEVLLDLVGIALPIGGTALYFLTYGLYLLAQVGIMTLFRPQVDTTYATVYDWLMLQKMLKEKANVEAKAAMSTEPRKLPWEEQ